MNKFIKGLAGAAVGLFGVVSTANAAIVGMTEVGSGAPNDDLASVNALVDPDVVWLAKINCGNDLCSSLVPENKSISASFFSLDVTALKDDEEAIGGTFTLNPGSGYLLTHLVVKAGNSFILYALDTPSASGTFDWNTVDLGNKGLSHLSFYGRAGDPVPLPAAGLLFLTAAGAGAFGLKRRKAKA